MKQLITGKKLPRILSVIAVLGVIAGVAFAALQSQSLLTGNSIETATADLQISTDGNTYAALRPGFDFHGLIPNGPGVPAAGYPIYLKNSGGTELGLNIYLNGPPSNPNNVDLNLVVVKFMCGADGDQEFTLQELLDAKADGGVPVTGHCGAVDIGTSREYRLQIAMNLDSVNGPSASLGNIDFAFSGVAQAN
ncbi:MAG TPA: hypothetical protein VIJ68_02365 [Candidatus Saccharimonadales bacterium]